MHAWVPFLSVACVAVVAAIVAIRATNVGRSAAALGVVLAATGAVYALRGHPGLALAPLAPCAALLALAIAGVSRRVPFDPEVFARSRNPEIGATLVVGALAAAALVPLWNLVTPIPADGAAGPQRVVTAQADLTLAVVILSIAAAGAIVRASAIAAVTSLALALSTAPLAIVALGHARDSTELPGLASATLVIALVVVGAVLAALEASGRSGAGSDLDALASSCRSEPASSNGTASSDDATPPDSTAIARALDEASDAVGRWADGAARTQITSLVVGAIFLLAIVAWP